MLQVKVVDDDYRVIAQLTDILERYYGPGNYVQEDYSDGLEFVQSLMEGLPDMVFMDLEMDLMNGEEAVRRLREIDVNENIYVIYISSHTEQLAPLFSLHPFDFLVKPIEPKAVFRILDRIKEQLEDRKKTISLVIGRKEVTLPVSDIMWIQSLAHRLEIRTCTDKELLYCYGKLNDLYPRLAEISSDFWRIHASFVVNRRFITKYSQEKVCIQAAEFPISLKYRAEIIMKLHERL